MILFMIAATGMRVRGSVFLAWVAESRADGVLHRKGTPRGRILFAWRNA
jgi:hypothetical protein